MAIKYDSGTKGPSADTVTDPQKLFHALPAKDKKYAYLRDVQGDVLGKWFAAEKQKDTVIKMNTGSGKTTVGLLLLKSTLNEVSIPPHILLQIIISVHKSRQRPRHWA